jgi:small conductance mechanosensitive channel
MFATDVVGGTMPEGGSMDPQKLKDLVLIQGANFGLKLLGAIAIWIVGLWLIRIVQNLIGRAMRRQSIDATLVRYVSSTVSVLLKIALVVAILGFFGVQTTTFAALLAGIGLAIGAAWGGLLANFAAGIFLVILRPFRVGDSICAAGITGTVEEVGLFYSTINTSDNIRTIVPNNKIFSDNIQNFTANPYRRVDLIAQLHHSVDPIEACRLLRERIPQIHNVLGTPPPEINLLEFSVLGPVLSVRPYCAPQNYWQVYFDANEAMREVFTDAGYPPPENRTFVRNSELNSPKGNGPVNSGNVKSLID